MCVWPMADVAKCSMSVDLEIRLLRDTNKLAVHPYSGGTVERRRFPMAKIVTSLRQITVVSYVAGSQCRATARTS